MNPAQPFLAAAAQVLAATAAQATEEKPLWEVGAGAGTFTFPAYRGADKNSNWFLPVPYFTYQGDFLKADRNGIRGSFFDTDRLDLTVSAFLSRPSGSDNIPARAGMPELKAAFEIGQQVDVTLWRSENRARFFKLRLPLRTALTVEGPPKDVGWVFHPNLNLDITDLPGLPGWNLGLMPVRCLATSARTPTTTASHRSTRHRRGRPTRRSPAIPAASSWSVSPRVSRRFPKFWLAAFASFDNLNGATISDSPLVLEKNNFAVGIAVSWIFGESSARVMVND